MSFAVPREYNYERKTRGVVGQRRFERKRGIVFLCIVLVPLIAFIIYLVLAK